MHYRTQMSEKLTCTLDAISRRVIEHDEEDKDDGCKDLSLNTTLEPADI